MRVFVFIFGFFFCAAFSPANALQLKEPLQQAQIGDFMVIEYQKNYTFFYVLDTGAQSIVLEEISLPSYQVAPQHSWRKWFLSGAPKHLSWIRYDIDREAGTLTQAYSISKNRALDTSKLSSFLPQLLSISFSFVPQDRRQRIGPPPPPGEKDVRPLWKPAVRLDGQWIEGVVFDVWQARWPKDGSELSEKEIEIYLACKNDVVPSYFPYWLQIKASWQRAKFRVVDSGRKLLLETAIR